MTTLFNETAMWSPPVGFNDVPDATHALQEAAAHKAAADTGTIELLQRSSSHPLVVSADAALAAAVGLALHRTAGAAGAGVLLVAIGAITGLYHRRSTIETQGALWYIKALALPVGVTAALLAAVRPHGLTVSAALTGLAATVAILLAARIGLWLSVARARRRGIGLHRTVVAGPSNALASVVRRIEAFPECGLKVIAVDAAINRCTGALEMVRNNTVDEVVVIGPVGDTEGCEELLHAGDGKGIDFHTVLPLPGSAKPMRPRIADMHALRLGPVSYSARPLPAKRAFDIAVSGLTLLFLAPVLLIVAIAIKLDTRGPVFFGQTRVGRNGETFKIWKFRSMVDNAAALMQRHLDLNVSDGLLIKLADDPRVTRVGRILRRFSLDELPQFFNVLRGDMSLVGPRPLAVDPDDFDDVATKRHVVRPGITGPWQVHGSHALSYDDMVRLDLAYINDWSFRRDLWLLLLTPTALVVRRAPAI